jgi:hypothetical protein
MSTMARDRIPASTWRGLAPSAARRPISRVVRETLMDTSEKRLSADRNKTTAVTAPLRCDSHEQAQIPLPDPFVQRPRVLNEQCGIDIAAMNGRHAANVAALPRTRTLITSGETVPADAA